MADTAAPDGSPCVNCGAALAGRYCHVCGEKRLAPGDRSLWHYVGGLVEAMLNLEGKLWKTLRALIARPGLLTAEYWRGRRVAYMKPLPLFLVANLLYFLLASWTGLTAVPFNFIVRDQDDLARVERKLHVAEADRAEFRRIAASYAYKPDTPTATNGVARVFGDYAQRYNATAPALSRSLILVMIAMVTPMLALVELPRRRRFPLVAHLVFATHLMTAFLLVFLATEWFWRLLGKLARLFPGGGACFGSLMKDSLWTVMPPIVVMAVYLYQGLRRFYEEGRVFAAAKAALLVVGMAAIFLAYQELLFYVTLLAT
jgi:hypothetical protein